jgi:DNA-binding IclR family transcriptional regulator
VAALSVSGPSFRLGTDELLRNIVPKVTASADRLSRDLGFAPA